MSDKNDKTQITATIGTGLAVITVVISVAALLNNWLNTSIGEVRADIRELRTGLRADIRQVRDTAKADSDKNSDQLAAHLTSHAAPEAPKAE